MKNRKKIDQELAALARKREEDIDTSDVPEVQDWSEAVVGKFYRPIKEPVSLRLDIDVITWMKSEGPGYQTRINSLLREAMVGVRSSTQVPKDKGERDTARRSCRQLRFPSLERRGELENCDHAAELIADRGSVFACVR